MKLGVASPPIVLACAVAPSQLERSASFISRLLRPVRVTGDPCVHVAVNRRGETPAEPTHRRPDDRAGEDGEGGEDDASRSDSDCPFWHRQDLLRHRRQCAETFGPAAQPALCSSPGDRRSASELDPSQIELEGASRGTRTGADSTRSTRSCAPPPCACAAERPPRPRRLSAGARHPAGQAARRGVRPLGHRAALRGQHEPARGRGLEPQPAVLLRRDAAATSRARRPRGRAVAPGTCPTTPASDL